MQRGFLSLNISGEFTPKAHYAAEEQSLHRERDRLRSLLLNGSRASSSLASSTREDVSPSVNHHQRHGIKGSSDNSEGNALCTSSTQASWVAPLGGGVWSAVMRSSASRSRSRSGSAGTHAPSPDTAEAVGEGRRDTAHVQKDAREPAKAAGDTAGPSRPSSSLAPAPRSPASDLSAACEQGRRREGAERPSQPTGRDASASPTCPPSSAVRSERSGGGAHSAAARGDRESSRSARRMPSFCRPTTASLTRSILVEEEQARRRERRERRLARKQRDVPAEGSERGGAPARRAIQFVWPGRQGQTSHSAIASHAFSSAGAKAAGPSRAHRPSRETALSVADAPHQQEPNEVDVCWAELQRVEDALELLESQDESSYGNAAAAHVVLQELRDLRKQLLATLDRALHAEDAAASRSDEGDEYGETAAPPNHIGTPSPRSHVPTTPRMSTTPRRPPTRQSQVREGDRSPQLLRPATQMAASLRGWGLSPGRPTPLGSSDSAVEEAEGRGPWASLTPPRQARPTSSGHPPGPALSSPPRRRRVASPSVRVNKAQLAREEASRRHREQLATASTRLWDHSLNADRLAAVYRSQSTYRVKHDRSMEESVDTATESGVVAHRQRPRTSAPRSAWPRAQPMPRREEKGRRVGHAWPHGDREPRTSTLHAPPSAPPRPPPPPPPRQVHSTRSMKRGGRFTGWLKNGKDEAVDADSSTDALPQSLCPTPTPRLRNAAPSPQMPSPSPRHVAAPPTAAATRLTGARHWEPASPSPMLPERGSFLSESDADGGDDDMDSSGHGGGEANDTRSLQACRRDRREPQPRGYFSRVSIRRAASPRSAAEPRHPSHGVPEPHLTAGVVSPRRARLGAGAAAAADGLPAHQQPPRPMEQRSLRDLSHAGRACSLNGGDDPVTPPPPSIFPAWTSSSRLSLRSSTPAGLSSREGRAASPCHSFATRSSAVWDGGGIVPVAAALGDTDTGVLSLRQIAAELSVLTGRC